VVLGVAALLLAACGGGGGGDNLPLQGYAVNAALGHLFADRGSWTMSGAEPNGQSFGLTLAFSPVASLQFPVTGVMAERNQETLTFVSGGVPDTVTLTLYLDSSTRSIVGINADGMCSASTLNTAPPSANVGASGPMFTASDLGGCASNSIALGTTASRWSLETDTGTVLLCWNLASQDLAGKLIGTETA
jgi:hypothetical protein